MHSGLLFYSTAAQIIPVLLLVIALERRFFRPAGGGKPAGYAIDLVLSAVGLLLIGWAELGALQALDRGHGTDTARTNVYVALGSRRSSSSFLRLVGPHGASADSTTLTAAQNRIRVRAETCPKVRLRERGAARLASIAAWLWAGDAVAAAAMPNSFVSAESTGH